MANTRRYFSVGRTCIKWNSTISWHLVKVFYQVSNYLLYIYSKDRKKLYEYILNIQAKISFNKTNIELTLRSWVTDWTNVNNTLGRSLMLIYVDALHMRTNVTAAPSVCNKALELPPWWLDIALRASSTKCLWKKIKY